MSAPTKRYEVKVEGCDDETVVEVDLTDDEAATVEEIAGLLCEASTFSCMPKMKVRPLLPG